MNKRKTQYVIKKKNRRIKKPEGPNHKLLNMISKK